jgi:hypothetical protein
MGVDPIQAVARIKFKTQLIGTIGTLAARGHAQLLLARLSALAPITAQRGYSTHSNQQIISLPALARVHYRSSIGTRTNARKPAPPTKRAAGAGRRSAQISSTSQTVRRQPEVPSQ